MPLRLTAAILLLSLLFLALNFWPRLFLRTPAMLGFESPHFVVWAENMDRREAIWVRTLLEDRGLDAAHWLGFPDQNGQRTQVFLYPDQSSFQIRRGGVLMLWRQRALYLVDHVGSAVVLTSPDHAGPFAESSSVLSAALDEYIRSLVDRWAVRLPVWLSEGMVLRLSSGSRFDEDVQAGVPRLEELSDPDRASFEQGSGPRWADAYIAWLEMKFGKDKLLDLCRSGGDYQAILGCNLASLYPQWIAWIRGGKPSDPRQLGGISALPDVP